MRRSLFWNRIGAAREPAVYAAISALVIAAAYVVLLIGRTTVDDFAWGLLLGAPAGAAAAALLVWPWWKGAWAGAAIGLLGHPLMCLILTIADRILHGRLSQELGSTLAAVLTFSAYSLVLTGWLTIPAGALLGRKLARRQAETNPQLSTTGA